MGGSRNYRQGVGVRDILTKNDFKSNYFTEGSNFKENTVQSSRGGGGVNFIQGRSNFFLEGVGSVRLFQWKPVLSWFENAINNCVSTSPNCTDVVEALTRLL